MSGAIPDIKKDEVLIYGLHTVTAALKKRPKAICSLWFDDSRHDERMKSLLGLAEKFSVPLYSVPKKNIEVVCPESAHQGVVAIVKSVSPRGESDLLEMLKHLEEPPFLLILDNIQDPHNLGACIRTANACGVHAVIVPKDRAVGLTPVVRKVSCGAAENTPFVQVTNLARTMRMLQKQGIWMIGAAMEGKISVHQASLTGALALVMGAEGRGLRRLTRENCDALINIPMVGDVESLNVSVATGVCLYEAHRQRQ